MGQITITTVGSFRNPRTITFSAMEGGHAHAVGRAIQYLSAQILPASIQQDHELHEAGQKPPKSDFGKAP